MRVPNGDGRGRLVRLIEPGPDLVKARVDEREDAVAAAGAGRHRAHLAVLEKMP